MATSRPFVVDATLTAVAIGFKNGSAMRIADKVLPRLPVSNEKFKYTVYPISEAFNTPDARVGRKGAVKQLEFSGTEVTSDVVDYGLDSPIPQSDIDAANAARAEGRTIYDPEAHAAEMLTETIENIREARAANMVFNAASYAASRRITLSGTSQFSDYANSDPIGVIAAGMDATLVYRPNTVVMGRAVWSKLSSHPKIVNAVKGNVSNQGRISIDQLKELLAGDGITEVLVGDAWANTAKPGQNPALARTWGNHLALLHINPLASVEQGGITFGFTAQFGDRLAGRIEDPDIGLQGGFRIRVGERVRELISAQDVGYFIQNAIA
ncbi:capsid protein [Rhodobacter capsulatus]|uniref:major capsid protein n=1 Tax=Rhodobacter capsulatus TaxID=1061 RepID=UPI004025F637